MGSYKLTIRCPKFKLENWIYSYKIHLLTKGLSMKTHQGGMVQCSSFKMGFSHCGDYEL